MTVKELLNVVPDGASIRFSDVENKPIYDGVVRNAEELLGLERDDRAWETTVVTNSYSLG